MLFILTNSQDATASFLLPFLEKGAVRFVRFDTDLVLPRTAFAYESGVPTLKVNSDRYVPGDISHIWYRRPEQLKHDGFDGSPEGKCAQAEWTEFIENFFAHVPRPKWVNHPSCNVAASRKLEQLTMAAALGFGVPDTLVTQEPNALREFYARHQGHIIAKPVSTGYVERPGEQNDSLIYTNRVLQEHLENLEDLAVCPTLFQQFIDKEYDVRITVMDGDIHAVGLFAKDGNGGQRCDIRRNNMSDVRYSRIELPQRVREQITALVQHYALRFAAIDMAVSTSGDWFFFEVNPNGQWAWLDESAGTHIADSFVRAFKERLRSAAFEL